MNRKAIAWISVAALVPLAAWTATGRARSLQEDMQRLARTLGELLPELVAKDGDPDAIEENAQELAELSHALTAAGKSNPSAPDAGPAIGVLAGHFEADIDHALAAIRHGDPEYGKQVLRRTTSHCIACHTRGQGGPELPALPSSPRIEKLRTIERAELYAATRQFDRALETYREVLAGDPAASWLDWERALHHALAIAVRVKRSPELTREIAEIVLVHPSVPELTRRNARAWLRSIESWKIESKAPLETDRELEVELARLLDEAESAQLYPADRSADILYLRASAVAHSLLDRAPDSRRTALAIRALGLAHDVMNEPGLWPIHDAYYEACIRSSPHTPIAEECYGRYEQAVYAGYSGSGGTFLPDDVRESLAQLKRLALPAAEGSAGARLYDMYCASCHGRTGRGDGPMADLLTVQPTNLTQIRAANGGTFPREEVHRAIDGRRTVRGHGAPDMPLWGLAFQDLELDANQERDVRARIDAILDHIEALQDPAPAGGDRRDR
jgi:mono/diheme cytochrome c family protein